MSSIRKTISSGFFYTAISKFSNVLLQLIIGAVLARLLSPEEFGIIAIVTVFVVFFNLLSDFGLGPAVIQNKNLDNDDIRSIFSFSLFFGFCLATIFYFCGGVIANFYNKSELINVSRFLSLAVLFYSFQVIPKALMQKELKFKQLSFINIGVQIITGTVAIILAFKGFSYYALVIKSILDGFITFIVYIIFCPVRPTLFLKFNSIAKIAKFSGFQFLFNFINYFSRNADNILIGKYFGMTLLGYYEKSYRLMTMPVNNLTHIISPVLLPVLSKHQNDKQFIYNSYCKVVKLLAIIGFPLSAFLYFSANEIIQIVFGSQWVNSVPVFEILALSVGIQMVLSSSGAIFQSLGRTDLLFISGLLSAFFMLGAICFGIFIGKNIEIVGLSLVSAFAINFFQAFYFLIHKALNHSLLDFLKVFKIPLLLFSAVSGGLFLLSLFNLNNMYLSLFIKVLVSGLIFVLVFNFFEGDFKRYIMSIMKI